MQKSKQVRTGVYTHVKLADRMWRIFTDGDYLVNDAALLIEYFVRDTEASRKMADALKIFDDAEQQGLQLRDRGMLCLECGDRGKYVKSPHTCIRLGPYLECLLLSSATCRVKLSRAGKKNLRMASMAIVSNQLKHEWPRSYLVTKSFSLFKSF